MSATTQDESDMTDWEPRGHPVRWALGLVVVIALLAGASIWFGAAAPRARLEPLTWGSDQPGSDELYVVVELTNEAHTDVDLVDAGASVPGLELTSAGVGPDRDPMTSFDPGDDIEPLDGPVTVEPGASVTVELRYRLTGCGQVTPDGPGIPFRLRTFLGRTQDVTLGSFDVDRYGAPVPWTPPLVAEACGPETGTTTPDEVHIDIDASD